MQARVFADDHNKHGGGSVRYLSVISVLAKPHSFQIPVEDGHTDEEHTKETHQLGMIYTVNIFFDKIDTPNARI